MTCVPSSLTLYVKKKADLQRITLDNAIFKDCQKNLIKLTEIYEIDEDNPIGVRLLDEHQSKAFASVLGVIEVKKGDFMKGFAQASVQMESTLTRKRKADEIDNGQDVDRVVGIVTDASE
ncbi:unnamed protein product [Rhizophagus irregularis]|uniref:Uncharacterized protein n=1 Tax=Rhizophagus irregularis TaxID=588596 RepID=A0A2I1GFK7_9GLOM|nr:hypothetical protein RhiirA4_459996 [Rhizophagus irregularis]CAB4434893.1 unnamed protein product [Rhizophagus irregularis]